MPKSIPPASTPGAKRRVQSTLSSFFTRKPAVAKSIDVVPHATNTDNTAAPSPKRVKGPGMIAAAASSGSPPVEPHHETSSGRRKNAVAFSREEETPPADEGVPQSSRHRTRSGRAASVNARKRVRRTLVESSSESEGEVPVDPMDTEWSADKEEAGVEPELEPEPEAATAPPPRKSDSKRARKSPTAAPPSDVSSASAGGETGGLLGRFSHGATTGGSGGSDGSSGSLAPSALMRRFAASDSASSSSSTVSSAGDDGAFVFPPKSTKLTPLEQQFVAIKRQHMDTLLLVEVGYKFQFFGRDAELAAKLLHIMCYKSRAFMAASVPVQRLFVHVRRLVEAGYKVGVVRQTETAALKKAGDNRSAPFTRKLTDVYTRATLVGADVFGLDEAENVSMGQTNYLLCLAEEELDRSRGTCRIGMVALHCASGDIVYDTWEDGLDRERLEARVAHINPAELILPRVLTARTEKILDQLQSARQERKPETDFNHDVALRIMCDFYKEQQQQHSDSGSSQAADSQASAGSGTSTSSSQGAHTMFNLPPLAQSCVGALIKHLREFGLEHILQLHGNAAPFGNAETHMELGAATVRNLEIFQNETDGRAHGSLLWVLDRTQTPFGRRTLRKWVAQPLRDASRIMQRLDAVEELQSPGLVGDTLREVLRGLPDLERGIAAAYYRKCTTAEFYTVVSSLVKVHRVLARLDPESVAAIRSDALRDVISGVVGGLEGLGSTLAALDEKAARACDKENLFRDVLSRYPAVADTKRAISETEAGLEAHTRDIRRVLKVGSFAYKTVSGEEYLIEVRNSLVAKLPSDWCRISGTKSMTRLRTPYIVDAIGQLAAQREQLAIDAAAAWRDFLGEFAERYDACRRAVRCLAAADCLMSLADVASEGGYVRPEIVVTPKVQDQDGDASQQPTASAPCIDIRAGRHPIVAALMDAGQYVPNDTRLGNDGSGGGTYVRGSPEAEDGQLAGGGGERCQIITGPNMGGKSSYIRQVALIVIMSQIGSFVPAARARVGLVDAVYTRMGASDRVFAGLSTFMVELQEAAHILRRATARSLVIMDELGRGTSTHDGVAIACATLSHLLTQVRCLTLFVTHYPPVSELASAGVASNYHMAFMEEEEARGGRVVAAGSAEEEQEDQGAPKRILFLYKCVSGAAGRSYGLNVARLARLPEPIIRAAGIKSNELERAMAVEAGSSRRLALARFLSVCAAYDAGDANALLKAIKA
eukprot:UC1_evm1s91